MTGPQGAGSPPPRSRGCYFFLGKKLNRFSLSLRGRGGSGGAGGRGRLCAFSRLLRHSVIAVLSPCSQACSSSCGHGQGLGRGSPGPPSPSPVTFWPPPGDASCPHLPQPPPAPHPVLIAPLATPWPRRQRQPPVSHWALQVTLCIPLGATGRSWASLATLYPTGHPTSPRALLVPPGNHQPPSVPPGTTGHPTSPWALLTTAHIPWGPPAPLGPPGHYWSPSAPWASPAPTTAPRDAPHLILAVEEPHAAIAEPGDRAQVPVRRVSSPPQCRAIPCRCLT